MSVEIKESERDDQAKRADEEIPEFFRLSRYDYHLPSHLIAQEPAESRDGSRLLHVQRSSGKVSHHRFRDLVSFLQPTDVLVLNETRVTPALLTGRKESGGRVELLTLDPAEQREDATHADHAERICVVKTSKALRPGMAILLSSGHELKVIETVAPGRARVSFPVPESRLIPFLEAFGAPPLPPYIRKLRDPSTDDRASYQTVYAKVDGSVAAPTAGLHFTDELLDELETSGVETQKILLHVGPGTFTPVRSEDIRLHSMEQESFEISAQTADAVNRALRDRRRVIAVGTTSIRALESAWSEGGGLRPGAGRTSLFIKPGFRFNVVSGVVTNFHLPKSTLLMLVCAFAGVDLVMSAYAEAVAREYRFYSYGDASIWIN